MGKFGFELVDTVTEEATKTKTRYNYLKLKENDEPKTIRFITEPKENESILTYSEHYVKFKNGWNRAFSCPDYGNTEAPTCVICPTKAGVNGDVLELTTKNKFLMQVIERDAKDPDPETKEVPEEGVDTVKVFSFTPFLWTTLSAFRKEYKTLGDRDYKIQFVKTKLENNKEKISYIVEPLEPSKLSKEDKALIENIPSLTEIEPSYDATEFQNIVSKPALKGGKDASPSTEEDINDFLNQALNSKSSKKSKTEEDDDGENLLASLKRTSVSSSNEESKPSITTDDDDDDEIDFSKLMKNKSSK